MATILPFPIHAQERPHTFPRDHYLATAPAVRVVYDHETLDTLRAASLRIAIGDATTRLGAGARVELGADAAVARAFAMREMVRATRGEPVAPPPAMLLSRFLDALGVPHTVEAAAPVGGEA